MCFFFQYMWLKATRECITVRMRECMYVRVRECVCVYVCMCVRMHACMYVCMYACMYACMYVRTTVIKLRTYRLFIMVTKKLHIHLYFIFPLFRYSSICRCTCTRTCQPPSLPQGLERRVQGPAKRCMIPKMRSTKCNTFRRPESVTLFKTKKV